ncbi:MAG: hypothetical protein P9L95_00530 [Candidatus Tenebribacter mawsonii]|nr:hypothetical protein [Candidatus Tenebribacter mawsonii]
MMNDEGKKKKISNIEQGMKNDEWTHTSRLKPDSSQEEIFSVFSVFSVVIFFV